MSQKLFSEVVRDYVPFKTVYIMWWWSLTVHISKEPVELMHDLLIESKGLKNFLRLMKNKSLSCNYCTTDFHEESFPDAPISA